MHANDKVDFVLEGDRIILMPVKTLRDLRGAVTGKDGDLEAERRAAKQAVGTRNIEETP